MISVDGVQKFAAMLQSYEVLFKHKTMPNGEERFAIVLPTGGELIITLAGCEGGWQNAHYHGGPDALGGFPREGVSEYYQVWSGWMAAAVPGGTKDMPPQVTLLTKGDEIDFLPGMCHNIYLPARAVIATLKAGIPVGNPDRKDTDWWPAPQLDQATKQITEADLRNLVDLQAG